MREAHEATLRGFVKALEAKDLYTRGHTERVAYFAQLTGQELSFSGTQLERLRWAALIHDVGKLAVPGELIRKKGRLSADEYLDMKAHAHLVEEILAEVEFLEPMVEIASEPSLPLRRIGIRRQRGTVPVLNRASRAASSPSPTPSMP